MNVRVLASSSQGNCYIIEDGSNKLILDAGINIKNIKKGLDFDLSQVDGCLITHEHQDHYKSSYDLAKAGVQVYLSKGTADTDSHHNYNFVESEKQITCGGFTVLPFEVQHDAREPLGFLIKTPSGKKIVYATDTYYLKYRFYGVHMYMIECNHDDESLQFNITNGYLPKALIKRLKTSHFSFENVKDYLSKVDLSSCEDIVLIHLSDRNSNGLFYKSEIQKMLGIPVTIAEKGILI